MKRPLVSVVVFYVAGILLAEFISLPPFALLTASLSLALVAIAWKRARPILLYALIVVTGWTAITLRTAIISPRDLRNLLGDSGELVTVRGTLRETPSLRVYEHGDEPSWRTMAQLDVAAVQMRHGDWQPASGRMAVTTPGELTNFFAGQILEITGIARPPRIAAAEGTFDYRAYLREHEIYYQLHAGSEKDWRILSSPSQPPLADRFREWGRRALALGLPGGDESLRLEWALTLGWKAAMTEEVSEPFVRAATYHIFAVDGLRMAILFGIFFGLFRAFGVPRWICGLALLPVIWFYTALTGWPASAIRASVMLTVIIIGWALKRPSDIINSLFAAALIILIWEPQQLFQAGFQLSFVVVLCIILMVPALHNLAERVMAPDPLLPDQLRRQWHPVLRVPARFTWDTLVTSFAAWIGSLPLVAYYFHIVTPVSTPANLLAVPLCALVLMSNLGSLLLAGWFSGAAELFNHAGWFFMECIRVSSHWFATWPRAYFYFPMPSLFTGSLYYLLLFAFLTGWIFKARLRGVKIALLVLLVCGWGWQYWRDCGTTRLTILPLNGGASVYLDAPGTKDDLLMDCGASNSVQLVTKPFLRGQGVNRLPGLLLTHGDARHVGGTEMLLDSFPVEQVWASPIPFRSPVYRRILERLLSPVPAKIRTIGRNEHLGGWTLLHPSPQDRFPQADDNTMVLSGTFERTRILLLSDLARAGQSALLERTADLRADIVVTGIPSGSEALGDALLGAIQPRVIVVVDSEFPVGARASVKLRGRLEKQHVPVIYTRSAGAVTIELRDGRWELRTMSGIRRKSSGSSEPR